jgi:hypothetical protein
MLKRVVLLAGAFGTIMTLAAVGCSGSSNDLVDGGDSGSGSDDDGSTGFVDSGKRIDSGPVTTDAGNTRDSGSVSVVRDAGAVIVNEGGVVVDTDSGTTTIHPLDAGSAVIDAGTVVEVDGGTTGSCFNNSAALELTATAPLAHQNRCTSTQISAFNASCLESGATTSGCNAVVAADPDCADCLFGGNIDGGVGVAPALLPVNGLEQINIDGCLVAISGAPAACALQYQQLAFCGATTCATCVSDNDNNSCLTFSETDPSAVCATDFPVDATCAGYVNALTLGQSESCAYGATDFSTAYTTIATTMCGP